MKIGSQITPLPNRRMQAKRGLTLVELLVVLAIITAVAGIVIPIIPDSQERSHGATGAGNIREIAKAVELHRSATGSFGDEWDSLIDSNGLTVTSDLQVLNINAPAANSDEEAVALALAAAGIATSYEHDDFSDDSVDQTFDGLTTGPVLKLGGDNEVSELTSAGEAQLGLEPSGVTGSPVRYIAFGLGRESTLIGRSLVDTPVQYPSGATNPTDHYSRFIVVFAVPENGSPLRLATITAVENLSGGDRLQRLGDFLNDYFDSFN